MENLSLAIARHFLCLNNNAAFSRNELLFLCIDSGSFEFSRGAFPFAAASTEAFRLVDLWQFRLTRTRKIRRQEKGKLLSMRENLSRLFCDDFPRVKVSPPYKDYYAVLFILEIDDDLVLFSRGRIFFTIYIRD